MRTRAPERGAAAVEMAIVMPLLLFVLFLLVDFGRLFDAQIQLTQAAREGVRLAALNSTSDPADPNYGSNAITARVQLAAPAPGGGGVAPSATPTWCGVNTATYPVASVSVSMPFQFITPLGPVARMFQAGSRLGDGLTLTSTGVMRCAG